MSTLGNKTLHIRIILGLTLLCSTVLFSLPPIPQPPEYHQFADSRLFLGMPNFLDVTSNLLFLAAAAYGLKLLFNSRHGMERVNFEFGSEIIPYTIFFAASGVTCFGSIYYHLSPDNFSLIWDRLPMTVMFGSFLTIVISERINQKAGLILLPILLLLGIFSIYHWYQTELINVGDLRLYLMIQFFPILLILYMLFFLPSRYSRSSRFGWILALYAVAKVAEMFDQEIFNMQPWISGHTIKHILAALAVFALAEMLRRRVSINQIQHVKDNLDQY
ncbi:MAG: hypothetical protein R8K54_08400 [Mariprofundaceae bacterium]